MVLYSPLGTTYFFSPEDFKIEDGFVSIYRDRDLASKLLLGSQAVLNYWKPYL